MSKNSEPIKRAAEDLNDLHACEAAIFMHLVCWSVGVHPHPAVKLNLALNLTDQLAVETTNKKF